MYENACEESSGKSPTRFEQVPLNGDVRTSSIKEKFERGDVINDIENEKAERMQREKQEDLSVFEQGKSSKGEGPSVNVSGASSFLYCVHDQVLPLMPVISSNKWIRLSVRQRL